MERSLQSNNTSDELSVKELVLKVKATCRYLIQQWKIVLLCSFLGALLGIGYSIIKKSEYTAICTFVLEDGGKSGGMNQYAGLASLVGISGGGSGSGGIFQGDNILQLYMSRLMIQKTLLSDITINGKKQLLIDKYLDVLIPGINEINKHTLFDGEPKNFSRQQDSLLMNVLASIGPMLYVDKLDKKSNIIVVKVTSPDEFFSKAFADRWVRTVNDFYIKTKTKTSLQSVQVLQKQADSIRTILNNSISGVASTVDAIPNANPLLSTLKVPTQKKQIDLQSSMAIYSEVVKNLEISKMSLRQETPLIQVIDEPIFPLPVEKLSKTKAVLIGGFLAGFLTILILLVKRVLNDLLK